MRENSLWDASWQQAIAFQRELLAMAGWPDCRAAYEENLQKAKDRAAYCQQLLDHPQRGGQGTDIASRKRALADALAGVAWRQALLDGLKEAEASERGLISDAPSAVLASETQLFFASAAFPDKRSD